MLLFDALVGSQGKALYYKYPGSTLAKVDQTARWAPYVGASELLQTRKRDGAACALAKSCLAAGWLCLAHFFSTFEPLQEGYPVPCLNGLARPSDWHSHFRFLYFLRSQ